MFPKPKPPKLSFFIMYLKTIALNMLFTFFSLKILIYARSTVLSNSDAYHVVFRKSY